MLTVRVAVLVLATFGVAPAAFAQDQAPAAVPSSPADKDAANDDDWTVRIAAAVYVLPDDDNYVQPTVAADRGRLHLEARYNYEALCSASGFIGWNLVFGSAVTLALTPMIGFVAGDTAGVIPGLELDLTWKRLELYSEGEYVFDLGRRRDRFFYNWSEASVWMTEWLRAGLVTQRTRAYQTPRDLQRGLLVGATASRYEWAGYLFNPGDDDQLFVASMSVTF